MLWNLLSCIGDMYVYVHKLMWWNGMPDCQVYLGFNRTLPDHLSQTRHFDSDSIRCSIRPMVGGMSIPKKLENKINKVFFKDLIRWSGWFKSGWDFVFSLCLKHILWKILVTVWSNKQYLCLLNSSLCLNAAII